MTILTPGVYSFDEIEVGDQIITGSISVSAEMIDRFADLSGDRFAIHMEKAAAEELGFDDRVAHGLLVLSLVDGLKNQADAQLKAVASLGWNWRFGQPVLAGDTVSATIAVISKRTTSKSGRGIAGLSFQVRNQHGELVQSGENQLMMVRNEASP